MQQHDEEPYYSLDTALFEGTFRYFHNEKRQVRGKAHRSDEKFSLSAADLPDEPMFTRRGVRTYVGMKAFVLTPDIRLTIGLFPVPAPGGAIGQVLGGDELRRKKEIPVAEAQAWYYPADRTLLVWECFLERDMRGATLAEDANMRALWEGFITFLRGQFPGVTRVVSPVHEPIYDNEEYQAFLGSLGFAPIEGAKSWGKPLIEATEE